jgi:hypothetical protein
MQEQRIKTALCAKQAKVGDLVNSAGLPVDQRRGRLNVRKRVRNPAPLLDPDTIYAPKPRTYRERRLVLQTPNSPTMQIFSEK